jgi:tetratricopeptide (TPR) repeat protein
MAVGWPVEPDALDRALELALRAQELDPALAYPYITRAGVHLNRGESQEAEAAARKVIEMIPGEPFGYLFLGFALLQQQEFTEALAAFRTTIRLNPRASEVAPMKGVLAAAQYRLGQEEEAVALWEKARAANPDLVTFRIPLAEHYELAGQHQEAAEIVREILAVNPGLTAEAAASHGFVGREAERTAELAAVLRRAGLP